MTQTAKAESLPTKYAIEYKGNGSVVVKDVPVFGENKRDLFFEELNYDHKWLKKALKNDQKLRSNGYKAPMHFGHHGGIDSKERAGFFELTEVRLVNYNDEDIYVIFANLVFDDEIKFEKAKKEFPYRSVEISFEKPNEINSLALLSSEAPFFRFPNMEFATKTEKSVDILWKGDKFMIGTEKDSVKAESSVMKQPPKVYGDENKNKPMNDEDPSAQANPEMEVKPAANEADPNAEKKPQAPKVNQIHQEAGTNKLDVAVELLTGMMEILNKLVDADENKVNNIENVNSDEEESEDDGDNKVSEKTNKSNPVVSASAEVAKPEVAALEGQIAALQAKIAKMEKQREDDVLFATLKSELLPYGLTNLDEELRKRVADGSASAWAAGIKQIAPPKSRVSENPTDPVDAPEVAAFASKGVNVLTRARELAATYAAAPKGHFIRNHKLADFLASQLADEVN